MNTENLIDSTSIKLPVPLLIKIVRTLTIVSMALIVFLWLQMLLVLIEANFSKGQLICNNENSDWRKHRCEIVAEYIGSHFREEYGESAKIHVIKTPENRAALVVELSIDILGEAVVYFLLFISIRRRWREMYVMSAIIIGMDVVTAHSIIIKAMDILPLLVVLDKRSYEYICGSKKRKLTHDR